MTNVQVRIPDDLLHEIEEISESMHTSRSEVIRRLLHEGISKEKLEMAVKRYVDDEVTLCKAAEIAGVSVSKFAEYAGEKEIPFMRYSPEEAEEDLERLRKDESTD